MNRDSLENQPSSPPRGLLQGFASGCRASLDGFSFMCRHPSLWAYGIRPVILNVLLTLLIWLAAFALGRSLVDSVTEGLGDGWWDRIQWWLWLIGSLLVTLVVAFVSYLILMSVFCSVFFSLLARKVELKLGARESDFSDVSLLAGVWDAVRAAGKLVGLNLVLLALNVIPVVGTLAATLMGLYVSAFVLGVEFFSFPLELRGMRLQEREAYARTWRGETLGVGIVVAGLMLIPVVGAVFQATSVVGAVLLCRRLSGLPVEPSGPDGAKSELSSSGGETEPV